MEDKPLAWLKRWVVREDGIISQRERVDLYPELDRWMDPKATEVIPLYARSTDSGGEKS